MRCIVVLLALALPSWSLAQTDPEWPRWRGPKGDGFWEPKPLPADFAEREPQSLWKVPVGKGFGGVTVSSGRVYLMDRQTAPTEQERVLCFDARDGKLIWQHIWPVKYGEMGGYATGPRASGPKRTAASSPWRRRPATSAGAPATILPATARPRSSSTKAASN